MVREQIARERRRQRTLWTSVAVVAVVLIAGLIGWGVYAAQKPAAYTAPPGATADGSGITVGSGKVQIDVYEDFQCPVCKQFESTSGATRDQLVAAGRAKVIYHPVAFLNRFSTTEYSTRSSAASGCAAEGGKYREYSRALFGQQPPENSAGLPDDQLITLGDGVGLTEPAFGSCVRSGKYKSWTAHVTDRAAAQGVSGTPTVLVAGKHVAAPTPDGLTTAVTQAGG
jgi:protein-disulfide isomerase